jgi:hypothetical protein
MLQLRITAAYIYSSTLEGAAEGVVYEEVGFIRVLCSVFLRQYLYFCTSKQVLLYQ